ncbi:signal transduction histidine kinase [Vreelandella songnenensis]|uniref:Signal transduction histidine kinase n=1 Tax=Vreelandella songnenensis TaxID=1176243 RepID=A0A2T0V8Q8_9GAMM|nr:HAMP domain-containing histidine kinase [Halomonas songnenensis]PRY66438.1 signal transduction histidine kinase [Halomonas songnenensis]
MNIRYRISSSDGSVIFCNLHPKEIEKINSINSRSQKLNGINLRAGRIFSQHGTVVAFSSDKNYIKSSAKFSTALNIILDSTEMINHVVKEARANINKNTSRLIHNLTSLNAHNIQEIYSLIPQENVSQKIGGQISFVEDIVKREPREAALSFLRIAKNNAAMKAEFSVFRKLFDSNPDLQIREHNVHKVLMNIFYLFFSDFTDKDVRVKIANDKNKYFANFDYESFHVAIYHIIENAAKYIKPKTTLNVEIKDVGEFIEIVMDMISLEIKKGESDEIFEEGVSGELANRIGKAGDGIGMNRAKKILELNSGSVLVNPVCDTVENFMGVNYQRNIFTVSLPKRKSTWQ